jgi:hypothetical protein
MCCGDKASKFHLQGLPSQAVGLLPIYAPEIEMKIGDVTGNVLLTDLIFMLECIEKIVCRAVDNP